MDANGTIYKKTWGRPITGTGTLVVRMLKRDGSEYVIQAYLPGGLDLTPMIFARGSLEECRTHYKRAVNWMNKYFPNDGTR